jgi:hypothetical protein
MTDLSEFAELCPGCQQPILWPLTVTGAQMPVDAEPVLGGNVMVHVTPAGLGCDVKSRADCRRLHAGGHLLYRHHRITCTRAEKWARPQRKVPAVDTAGTPGEGLF